MSDSGGSDSCEAEGGLPVRAARGSQARERLVREATRIFADKGFSGASTREICEAAEANVAAIHYYFGDKAGLYREVLTKPMLQIGSEFHRLMDPELPVHEAMRILLGAFLMPMAERSESAALMRVHLREMLEPTDILRELIREQVAPHHLALVGLLARYVGAAAIDDDLHQLAFALTGMANNYCVSCEFMQTLAPGLLEEAALTTRVLDRMVGYACALIEHERLRRTGAGSIPAENVSVPGVRRTGRSKRAVPKVAANKARGRR